MALRSGTLTITLGVTGIAGLVGLSLAGAVQAQTAAEIPSPPSPGVSERQVVAGGKMSFDVISIKPSKPGTPPSLRLENNRFTADFTLFGYIVSAYDLMPSREQIDSMLARVPKWVSTDSFEIQAVAEGNPTEDQMWLMVRSLLADRFRLEVHTVTAQVPALALVLEKPGKTGPKLRPHSEGQPCDVHLRSQDSRQDGVGVFPPVCEQLMAVGRPHGAILTATRNTTLEKIATFISSLGQLGRPVVDQTGLSGRFDFTLEFTPERKGPPPQDVQPDDFQVTTLQEALQEQLGLKLKTTNASVDTLIVDHVERPSEN